MSGEFQWHPISYDTGPGTNDLSEIPVTEIVAHDFPAPHERPGGRPEGVDSISFSGSLLELLLESGRSPESVAWAAAHSQGSRGTTHCLIFEQRQVYLIRIISKEYEAWIDSFDAELTERFAPTEHSVPDVWFMHTMYDKQRVVSGVGGFLFHGEWLDHYERAEQFRTDLHGWLRAASPRRWHGQDDQPKKDAFLDEAAQNAGPYVAIDNDQLVVTFRRFLGERGQQDRTGASDADISNFADIAGFELPSELQTVLRIADGCYLASGYCDFMSTAAVAAAWESQNSAFEGATFDEVAAYNEDPDPRTLPINLTPRWIPITDHHSGVHVGIDLLPGPNGTPGQIIQYDLGEPGWGAVVIAENLLHFFEQELAGQVVNINEWEAGEIDDSDIVEESWIALKFHEERTRLRKSSS